MVHEHAVALGVTREASDDVVDDDHVVFEALEHEVERAQRHDGPAGGDVDVRAEGAKAARVLNVGVGVGAQVALGQVRPDTGDDLAALADDLPVAEVAHQNQ